MVPTKKKRIMWYYWLLLTNTVTSLDTTGKNSYAVDSISAEMVAKVMGHGFENLSCDPIGPCTNTTILLVLAPIPRSYWSCPPIPRSYWSCPPIPRSYWSLPSLMWSYWSCPPIPRSYWSLPSLMWSYWSVTRLWGKSWARTRTFWRRSGCNV